MTNEQINTLIAEKVFGYNVAMHEFWNFELACIDSNKYHYDDCAGDWCEDKLAMRVEVFEDGSGEDWQLLPDYCTDIKAAMEAVDEIQCHNFELYWEEDHGWHCQFGFWNSEARSLDYVKQSGDTPAAAICKACLAIYDISEE